MVDTRGVDKRQNDNQEHTQIQRKKTVLSSGFFFKSSSPVIVSCVALRNNELLNYIASTAYKFNYHTGRKQKRDLV